VYLLNILFDISHPAHFHLLKNLIKNLDQARHNIMITIHEKDVLVDLLNHDCIKYTSLADPAESLIGLSLELIFRNIKMIRLCRHFRPDLLVGSSTSVAQIGWLLNKNSLIFSEDDDNVAPIFAYLTYPFAYKIINPSCLNFRKWKKKRVIHESYHELAYLHPDNFKPDRKILKKYGLKEKKYVIVRFSALRAHHDVGAAGISKKLYGNIEPLFGNYQIIKSIENETSHQIAPWDMHHILSFAKIIVSDSQTMTIEGSVLGIPAVRINTFIGKSTVIEELEKKYHLSYGMFPDQEELILETIQSLIKNPNTDVIWKKRRVVMLSEKIDFNQWMINFINNELDNLR